MGITLRLVIIESRGQELPRLCESAMQGYLEGAANKNKGGMLQASDYEDFNVD